MQKQILILSVLSMSFAVATPQTYVLRGEIDEATKELCKTEYKVDSNDDLAKTILSQTPLLKDARQIEDSKVVTSNPGGYSGDVFTQVFVISQNNESYKGGVYSRLELVENGKGEKRESFTVYTEVLNYRNSAELAESSICAELTYTLKK